MSIEDQALDVLNDISTMSRKYIEEITRESDIIESADATTLSGSGIIETKHLYVRALLWQLADHLDTSINQIRQISLN